jgi:hypothetical protein
MVGFRLSKGMQIIVVVMLLLSIIQILPIDRPMVGNASAGSSWVTSNQTGWSGNANNTKIILDGNITLVTQDWNFQDDFTNENHIAENKNVVINNITGKAELIKIIETFGRSNSDTCNSIEQTTDGGYILTGTTKSYGAGSGDVWLIKTDSSGNELWNKTFGGSSYDEGESINETNDGGFIITGWTYSYTAGENDIWLVKTDSFGNEMWNKTFGGNSSDYGYSGKQTTDGGYIVLGITRDYDLGPYNATLIKTDSAGNIFWNKTFTWNITNSDHGYSVQQTLDGGYIFTGYTEFQSAEMDLWLVKTDSSGNEMWNKAFGGVIYYDQGHSVQQTSDGGYIITGNTKSYGAGLIDVWLIKTDSFGNETWNKTFGGGSSDSGYSVQQTSDGGYVIAGMTYSYGAGGGENDVWIIKTDSSGNEQWNKTFGGINSDSGESVQQTSDGGYIVTGKTKSYGAGNFDIWLIKTNKTGHLLYSTGELTSTNLLAGQEINSINQFNYNFLNVTGIGTFVQFSQDKINWYNSLGVLNDWNQLNSGTHSIDLTLLGWKSGSFFYHMNFSYGGVVSPTLYSVGINADRYVSQGTYESSSHDTGGTSTFKTISWTNSGPSSVEFQLRTAATEGELSGKDFVGPGGLKSVNYTSPGEDIWTGHNGDRWVQWKAYLYTGNLSGSPILEDVTINYNRIPSAPSLVKPVPGNFSINNTPAFNWTFFDPDSTQAAFQLVIDDNSDFSSINYDSGIQSSPDPHWAFPQGTAYSTITDGEWYWKVRTQDSDGDWGPFSPYWSLEIDTTPPNPFTPIATPGTWTKVKDQIEIAFDTTDATSSVFKYDLTIKNSTYTNTYPQVTSPYELPAHPDGIYNITVAAFDYAQNVRAGWVDIYIDTTPPLEFTPIATPSGWTSNTQPEITFMTTDEMSGISHYQVDIDQNEVFTNQTSPYILPSLTDGLHNITVRAIDLAGNWIEGFDTVFIDTTGPASFIPAADPSSWTNNTQPKITFSAADATSDIDHYELKVDTGTFTIQTSPYKLPSQTDGVHNITVRAYDQAGNYQDGNVDVYIDTTAPTITHTVVLDGIEDLPLAFTATVTDAGSGVDSVNVHYRKPTETSYAHLELTANGNTYSGEIFANLVTTEGLEYYLEAVDKTTSANIAYFGWEGWTTNEPNTLNDIDITIIGNDTTSPTVIDKSPIGNDIPVDTTISITFDEAMDHTTSESAFSISPSVTGSFNWDLNKLIFKPSSDLEHETEYTITITADAKDLVDNPLVPDSWKFTTTSSSGGKSNPEALDDSWKPQGDGISVNDEISISFSEPMEKSETEAAFSITPNVIGVFDWDGTKLIFIPSKPLDYETQYNVSISPRAKNLDSISTGQYHNWSFITEDEPVEKKSSGFDWEVWEPIITILTILASLVAFLLGFLSIRRKRSKLRKYMEKIDNSYNEHQEDPEECQQELTGLRDEIKHEVKAGKIEENHFLILDKKIDDYLGEIKASKKGKGKHRSKGKGKKAPPKEEEEEADWEE